MDDGMTLALYGTDDVEPETVLSAMIGDGRGGWTVWTTATPAQAREAARMLAALEARCADGPAPARPTLTLHPAGAAWPARPLAVMDAHGVRAAGPVPRAAVGFMLRAMRRRAGL